MARRTRTERGSGISFNLQREANCVLKPIWIVAATMTLRGRQKRDEAGYYSPESADEWITTTLSTT